jgi:integrase/recombinase XerD
LGKKIRVPPLKEDDDLVKTLPPQNLKALLSFKPQNFVERRIHLLTLLILDTGVRIQEAIFLGVPEIDLDNLVFKIKGKGRKERIVPFSFELRKHIVKYLNLKFFHDLPKNRTLFCNLEGGVVLYNNLRRDYLNMLSKIGVPHQGAFHRLRHTFATNYVKSGGNVLYLQKVLGHTELSTTQIYVEADPEALKEVQMRTSLLSRGRY